MDFTAHTPSEIDTLWADAQAPVNALYAAIEHAQDGIRESKSKAATSAYHARRITGLTERLANYRTKLEALLPSLAPFTAEWNRRGGWTRAYATDGHIHRSCSCHTLYATTRIGWLPEQSGLDEAEIVRLAGATACTICYPTAPVAELRIAAAAAKTAGRAAAKAERDAAAAAKAISNPDGTPLLDGMAWEIKTQRAAEIELVHALVETTYWLTQDGENAARNLHRYIQAAERILAALEYKTGRPADEIKTEAAAKADKKYRKEYGA